MFHSFVLVTLVHALLIVAHAASVRVGSAQIFGLDSDLWGNLLRIENAIADASSKGVDILVFPETILLGWVNPVAWNMSLPIPNNRTKYLGSLAVEYNMYICVGMAELVEPNLYDTAVLFEPMNGEIILKHRKINILTSLMTPPYTPGLVSNVSTVYVQKYNMTIGVLICADTFESSILLQMKSLNPDLLLVPYGWAATALQWNNNYGESLKDTVTNASLTVGCPVVGTDLIGEISHGPWTGKIYGGNSVICDYKKENVYGNDTQCIVGKDRNYDILVEDIQLSV